MTFEARTDATKPPIGRPQPHTACLDLEQILLEASACLAQLNAERLEELAASCRLLTREFATAGSAPQSELAQGARAARPALRVLGRVLDATRANLFVLHRVQARRGLDPLPEYAVSAFEGAVDGNH